MPLFCKGVDLYVALQYSIFSNYFKFLTFSCYFCIQATPIATMTTVHERKQTTAHMLHTIPLKHMQIAIVLCGNFRNVTLILRKNKKIKKLSC